MNTMPPPRIWIVDSDLVAQFNAKIKLRQAGLQGKMFCFDNAHHALVELMDPEIPGNGLPDIIVLNLSTPVTESWEFLNQLGVILNENSFPDVFLSASFEVLADSIMAKSYSMVKGYFVKPLTTQNVERIITDAKNLREV